MFFDLLFFRLMEVDNLWGNNRLIFYLDGLSLELKNSHNKKAPILRLELWYFISLVPYELSIDHFRLHIVLERPKILHEQF